MSSDLEHVSERHLGHIFLDCMKACPDAICQIDAATGEEETNASVLKRSIRLALSIRNYGLKPGDVLSLGGRNHLDLHIPFYAALLNGLPISAVDPSFKYDEIKTLFEISRPKIAFCQKEAYKEYADAVKTIGLNTKIVTFGGGENSMENFMEIYGANESYHDFKPSIFNLDTVYAFLVSTSGSTGKQKLAALKHAVLISKFNKYIAMITVSNRGLKTIALNISPINWISGYFNAIGLPLMGYTKLQTSNPDDIDHVIQTINKYKPLSVLMSPAVLTSLVSRRDEVDLTSFRMLTVTGSKIDPDILSEFRKMLHPKAVFVEAYGMTETIGPCLAPNPMGPPGSCGLRVPSFEIKLVDPETEEEVSQPNVPGELWVKGEMFSEFYNDPEETTKTFTVDGFYKTGDLLYRDENDNFFFVDRLKALIKFRNFHILPAEIEDVISKHPAVATVCVCGIPHPHDGQRPIACVVLREGCKVTSQEIKDLVASKLSNNKHLSGGVLFMDKLPMTSTYKIALAKLMDIVIQRSSDIE